jgi:putative (di)nucleoside polyphosphate hydrolase
VVGTLTAMGKPFFRAGVVAVVRRSNGDVLVFERADVTGEWQLPQGGVHEGETVVEAAWRELAEETGLTAADVRLVEEHPDWTIYAWPDDVASGRRGDRLGQAHRWFFFEPLRDDVQPTPDGVEFRAWKWMEPAALIAGVVGFRRQPYQQVLGG